MGHLLTLEDLASRAGLSLATIRRLREKGLLPREVRLGAKAVRFRAEDVETWEAALAEAAVAASEAGELSSLA